MEGNPRSGRRLAALLALSAATAVTGARDLPGPDSQQAVQCRAGDQAACAALIGVLAARPEALPPSPQQACANALQARLLDQIDCRRGHAAGCAATAAEANADTCPTALEPQGRAAVGLAAGEALPSAPILDAVYWRTHLARYPAAAFRAGVEGQVVLRVDVSPQGRAIAVVVETNSGNRNLDRSAMEAMRTQPFAPAMAGATAVIGRTRVTVPFVIGGRVPAPGQLTQMRSEPAPLP